MRHRETGFDTYHLRTPGTGYTRQHASLTSTDRLRRDQHLYDAEAASAA
jgi:hypothetical protein